MSRRPTPEPVLEGVRFDFEAAQLSIAAVARKHGVSAATVHKYADGRGWVRPDRRPHAGKALVRPFRAGDVCPGLASCPLRRQMLAKVEGTLSRLVDRVHEAAAGEDLPDAKLLSLLMQTMSRAADLAARDAARREGEAEEPRHDFAAYRRELGRLLLALGDEARAHPGAASARPAAAAGDAG